MKWMMQKKKLLTMALARLRVSTRMASSPLAVLGAWSEVVREIFCPSSNVSALLADRLVQLAAIRRVYPRSKEVTPSPLLAVIVHVFVFELVLVVLDQPQDEVID